MDFSTERPDAAFPAGALSPRAFAWLAAAAVALFVLVYIVPLNRRPLFMPDETRYGAIGQDYAENGDWARLRMAGYAYYEKPPLGYWINAAFLGAFGKSPLSVRLPSVASAAATALALFFLMRRAGRGRDTSLAAAIIYLTCGGVFGIGTFATLDSMFSLFVTLSMAAFFAGDASGGRRRIGWLALSGVACAAAFLTKGFTAAVIPVLTLAAWLPWERRARELARFWIVPVAAAVVIALPFALALHAANPGFWRYFVTVEHLGRFLNPDEGQNRQPFWFFLPIFAVGALPWTLLVPAMWRRALDPFARYCLCWLAVPFLFFSACGGKLPTYILPCFAPFAMLLADAVMTCRPTLPRRGVLAYALVLPVAVAGFIVWLVFFGKAGLRAQLLSCGAWAGWMVAIAAAVLLLAAASRRYAVGSPRLAAVALTGASVCGMFFAGLYFIPETVEERNSSSVLLEAAAARTPRGARLFADDRALKPVSWYFGKTDARLVGWGAEIDPSLEGNGFMWYDQAAEETPKELGAGRAVSVIMERNHFAEFASYLPAEVKPAEREEDERMVWALYLPAGPGGARP